MQVGGAAARQGRTHELGHTGSTDAAKVHIGARGQVPAALRHKRQGQCQMSSPELATSDWRHNKQACDTCKGLTAL
jgi:hypothetical protein